LLPALGLPQHGNAFAHKALVVFRQIWAAGHGDIRLLQSICICYCEIRQAGVLQEFCSFLPSSIALVK
jgi:hypothetical protein